MAQLAASCTMGDILVVYYSGHGSKVLDLDNDEADGQDEAFCLRSKSSGQF